MLVARVAGIAMLGAIAYVSAIVASLIFLGATYTVYRQFDPSHAPHNLQVALALLQTAGATVVILATSVAVPVVTVRRTNFLALGSVAVSGLLIGVTAHWYLTWLSVVNDCNLHSSVPYRVAGCS